MSKFYSVSLTRASKAFLVALAVHGYEGRCEFFGYGKHTAPELSVRGGLSLSQIDYEIEDKSYEADRKVLFASYSGQIDGSLTAYAQLGLIFDTEWDVGGNPEGNGYLFSFGGAGDVWSEGKSSVKVGGGISLLQESLDGKVQGVSYDAEVKTTEIELFGLWQFDLKRNLMPYAGLAIFPYSDGDFKVKGASSSGDVERDDILGLVLGCGFQLSDLRLEPEIILMSETTLTLSVGKSF